LAFVATLIFLLADATVFRRCWQRDVDDEVSGATGRTFQEMCDEPFSKLTPYGVPTNPSGLKWEKILCGRPTGGRELTNTKLSDALAAKNTKLSNALAAKAEFTKTEWMAFGIEDLRLGDFIFIEPNGLYFKPSASQLSDDEPATEGKSDKDNPGCWERCVPKTQGREELV